MDSPPIAFLQLPRTPGCVACGPSNPHGLHLSLFVDPADGSVRTTFVPLPAHIGFEGVVHGGVLATVLDEAMVWAATWAGRRFCLCGEMSVRYRSPAVLQQSLSVIARVDSFRPRLIQTSARILDKSGSLVAESIGKYVPLPPERNRLFVRTLIDEPASAETARSLSDAAG